MSKKVQSKAKKMQKPQAKKKVAKPIAKAKKPVVKKMVKPVAKVTKPGAKAAPQPMMKPAAFQPTVKPQAVPVAAASTQKMVYKVNSHVVYPTHGVGKITALETQMIGDIELKMLVIVFEKDKMTLRVPMHRAAAAGLRPISTNDQMKQVYVTLKAKARTSRGMWSRRAQEYETKINSGSVLAVAEVVRDLHQNVDMSERSYSERMIYESALGRLVGELAAAEGTDHKTATDKLMKLLRGKVAAAAAAEAAAKEAA